MRRVSSIARGVQARATRACRIAREIRAFRDYRWVGIYDVSPDEVRILGHSGGNDPAYPVFSPEKGLTGEAIRTRNVVIANDVAADSRYLTAFGDTRSEMIVPILGGPANAVIASIAIESESLNTFGKSDIELIQLLGQALMPLFRPEPTP